MSNSKLSALPPFTENNPPLANSAMEIILKGINRVNCKNGNYRPDDCEENFISCPNTVDGAKFL